MIETMYIHRCNQCGYSWYTPVTNDLASKILGKEVKEKKLSCRSCGSNNDSLTNSNKELLDHYKTSYDAIYKSTND